MTDLRTWLGPAPEADGTPPHGIRVDYELVVSEHSPLIGIRRVRPAMSVLSPVREPRSHVEVSVVGESASGDGVGVLSCVVSSPTTAMYDRCAVYDWSNDPELVAS